MRHGSLWKERSDMRTGAAVFSIAFLAVAFAAAAFTLFLPAKLERVEVEARRMEESKMALRMAAPDAARSARVGPEERVPAEVERPLSPPPEGRIAKSQKRLRVHTFYGLPRRSFFAGADDWFPIVAAALAGAALVGFLRTLLRRRVA